MSVKHLVALALLGALIAPAVQASPIFSVSPIGLVGGNRQWNVAVTPDASLFSGSPPHGSVGVEMGFSISPGSLVSVVKNATNFPNDNPGTPLGPGYPPNTKTTNFGVQILGNNAVANLGSDLFTTATPQQFVTITTLGSGPTTISWLGAYSGDGRIAQAGQNFDLYKGVVSVPEPASVVLAILSLTTSLAFARRRLIA
jgi:hypothetical protein